MKKSNHVERLEFDDIHERCESVWILLYIVLGGYSNGVKDKIKLLKRNAAIFEECGVQFALLHCLVATVESIYGDDALCIEGLEDPDTHQHSRVASCKVGSGTLFISFCNVSSIQFTISHDSL